MRLLGILNTYFKQPRTPSRMDLCPGKAAKLVGSGAQSLWSNFEVTECYCNIAFHMGLN